MILPAQQLLHARQTKENARRRPKRNFRGTASVFGLDRAQATQQLASPKQLDLDRRVYIRLEVFHDLRRDRLGIQEFAACIPFNLRRSPSALDMFVLNSPTSLAGMKKAKGSAKRCRRAGEPEDISSGDGTLSFLFSHDRMLDRLQRGCQAA